MDTQSNSCCATTTSEGSGQYIVADKQEQRLIYKNLDEIDLEISRLDNNIETLTGKLEPVLDDSGAENKDETTGDNKLFPSPVERRINDLTSKLSEANFLLEKINRRIRI